MTATGTAFTLCAELAMGPTLDDTSAWGHPQSSSHLLELLEVRGGWADWRVPCRSCIADRESHVESCCGGRRRPGPEACVPDNTALPGNDGIAAAAAVYAKHRPLYICIVDYMVARASCLCTLFLRLHVRVPRCASGFSLL